jgi:hypothetical protein
LFATGGHTRDDIAAGALLDAIPAAPALLAGLGHDADRFRDALRERSNEPGISSPKCARSAIPMALFSPKGVVASTTCPPATPTGHATPCATTAVPTFSSQPALSRPSSFSARGRRAWEDSRLLVIFGNIK